MLCKNLSANTSKIMAITKAISQPFTEATPCLPLVLRHITIHTTHNPMRAFATMDKPFLFLVVGFLVPVGHCAFNGFIRFSAVKRHRKGKSVAKRDGGNVMPYAKTGFDVF